ncbi:hypothetical protein HW555_003312 [Spodoptera exigua]|uniref:Cytosol aminopeptidase domain-containing protein n=1 Tax=Spodoptera exigua TaxID=7107 RepID=A0A835GKJ3_SPOEX|nr:hypothetical protein HW555_003312 [Spodoptera exigua]
MVRTMSNASVSIKFRAGLTPSDPEQQPVLIVGQAAHLGALNWDDVRCKLEPRVTEEAWRRGLQCVTSSPGDSCELWPRAVSLASLPARRSRHAAPARNHALAKIVRSTQRSTDETIVLVCRKRDVLANGESEDEGIGPLDPALCENTLSAEEVQTLQDAADATRLAARITDTPANIMNVDKFIEFAQCRTRPAGLTPSDPEQQPVLIVGQAAHLGALNWDDVRCKLEPRVTEEAWRRGLQCVTSSPGDSCELWPRAVSLASLPARRSRHAAPARNHALAKIVRSTQRSTDETIVLVCRKRDVLANGESEDEGIGPLDPALCENTLSAEEVQTLQDAADATRLAARITDTPANIMNVDKFIEEAFKVAKELDILEPTVIRGEELKARGMGGIYGVGRAAACPPALVTLSYMAPGAADSVAWVGKGIVYDTGGLSIKARTSMVGMKGDCGGAAAVLAAFALAVKSKPTINLHAVLCLAENAVGPLATRPDDIHTLYSGRTVEINNTDAEGRLVLSDGVVYASRDLKADTIVDVATLTGAQGTATGKYHAGIVSNSARLEARCVAAGLRCGDLAHPLPFAPELHFTEFTSCVADMKNSVADRNNAQPSCAGLFILSHLGFDFPGSWLHIDMAAPAHCVYTMIDYFSKFLQYFVTTQLNILFYRYKSTPEEEKSIKERFAKNTKLVSQNLTNMVVKNTKQNIKLPHFNSI